jgi:hypothetical protein
MRLLLLLLFFFSNLQAGPTNRNRTGNNNFGLATRSRASGGLRADAGSVRDPNRKGKFVIDITGEPAGPPKIPGGGPLCSWGLPRAGGITFRVAPPDFDIPKSQTAASDRIPPGLKGNVKTAGNDKGKGKKKM